MTHQEKNLDELKTYGKVTNIKVTQKSMGKLLYNLGMRKLLQNIILLIKRLINLTTKIIPPGKNHCKLIQRQII